MSARQTLQNAPNGTIFSRRVGNITYFLRKVGNTYEVWTSESSGTRSTVTLDQAVTFFTQHNLIKSVPAVAASPAPKTPPPPAPPQTPLESALATLRAGGQVRLPNGSAVVLVNNKLVLFNPSLISAGQLRAGNASIAEQKVQTQIANGNANIITQSDLARALNPTPAAPAPKAPAPVPAPKPSPAPTPKAQKKVEPTPEQPIVEPAGPLTGDIKFNPASITVDSVNNAGGLDSIENSAAKTITVDSVNNAGGLDSIENASRQITVNGITADKVATQSAATLQDQVDWKARQDWRVRLALSPESNYLYKASPPGILAPLAETDGVIFPYTPAINVNYAANYEAGTITHTNYKFFQYTSSSVDQVTITCDFTAQDTFEANYVLSVIHFFRSMTKMFYGQDSLPKNGTPPPLCYMFGMGGYQFAAHPLVINSFTYNLPSDVDYIKTTVAVDQPGVAATPPANNSANAAPRLDSSAIAPGGKSPAPQFNAPATNIETTWVPTKIQMVIGCYPIVSRNKISNVFSLKDYSSGKIFNGINNTRGGIW